MLKNGKNCNRMKPITYLYKNLIKITDFGIEKTFEKVENEEKREESL